ncbi:hypothetical protein RHGRI_009587 [Rhododendron griersonianum]|uniref:Uncharacterized protein n=1 Tax=Rhododendron griersonianum TaxID=479676 RepID=A0AAV6KG28_9ERIC|nr:hypothetical protein RHGRI_009587 [Rhododendron griersonianum]
MLCIGPAKDVDPAQSIRISAQMKSSTTNPHVGMDPFGSKTLNQPKASLTSPQAKDGGKKSVDKKADKKAAVDEEMKRMNKLPANSAYATHRLRVLNKVLQLLSIQEPVNDSMDRFIPCEACL